MARRFGGAAALLSLVTAPVGCAEPARTPDAQFARAQEHALSGRFAQAAKWYRRAAEQGHADAQISLARLYEWGAGVPQDYDAMLAWARAAAEQGQPEAQFVMGLVYSRALKWGHGPGGAESTWWHRLRGALDGTGVGLAQDDVQAYMWFTLAADQGHPTAWKHVWLLNQRLSPAQRAAARARAAEWRKTAA